MQPLSKNLRAMENQHEVFMTIAATVKSFLDQNKINYKLVLHPKTYSSKGSAAAAHVREDHIAKAVILEDSQGVVMAVIPGDTWVKFHAINNELNRTLELAPETTSNEIFQDCAIGAIPPLGSAYSLETVVVDEGLTSLANVYFEAGDHKNLVHVSGESFNRLQSGARHGYFSHEE
jgi:Ala-tRNA(Pro) deacylase